VPELLGGHCSHLNMYYIILVTTGQYKTWTIVGRPHLVRSPRFIHETMFYTQSIMISPRFIPQSVFYTQSIVHSPQSAFHILY